MKSSTRNAAREVAELFAAEAPIDQNLSAASAERLDYAARHLNDDRAAAVVAANDAINEATTQDEQTAARAKMRAALDLFGFKREEGAKPTHTPGIKINSVTAYGANTPTQGFTAQVTVHGEGLDGSVENLESLIAAAPEMIDLLRRLANAFYVGGNSKALRPVMAEIKPLLLRATEAR